MGIKAKKIWIINDHKGRKKAIVKLPDSQQAIDVATRLGMM